MTTNLGSAIGALDAGPVIERERRAERHAADDVWALAIAQVLIEHAPRLRIGGAEALQGPSSADESATSRTDAAGGEPTSAGPGGLGAPEKQEALTKAQAVPDQLTTELSDGRLGRLELIVQRGANGLRIVINVADSHVKALIMSEQQSLIQSLKETGLSVASLQIRHTLPTGIAFAQDRAGADRTREAGGLRRPPTRWRVYQGTLEEEEEATADAETERVDFTA
jgi:flagellar hook-length control protein FliK